MIALSFLTARSAFRLLVPPIGSRGPFLFRNLLPRNSKSQPPGNIMSGRRQFYKLSYFYTGCFGNHSSNGYILTLEITPLTRVLVLQAPNYHQNKQKTGGTIYRLS